MALKYKKSVILAAIETTYGEDAAPGGANAILVRDLEIGPLEGDTVSRELVKPGLGNEEQIHVGVHQSISFAVELAGAGTPGTAPGWGPLLRACGFSETVAAGVDVQYDPVSADEESLSIYFHMDGQKHTLIGCRGSVKISIAPKSLPLLHFAFRGLWADPDSTPDPTPDFSAFMAPVPVSKANTPTFSLHGHSPATYSLELDMAVEAPHLDLIGLEEIPILDRKPTGSVRFQAPPISTKNFFVIAKDGQLGSMQLEHGTDPGHTVRIDCPRVQILQPRYGNESGAAAITANLSLIATDAGDDEIRITVK